MDEMIELRCKYCGAPLDRGSVESEAQYVTCPYCGTTQQRVDAKAYMDQMMAQIKSWIGKAIPGGFSLSQTDNVDPIARHNIFVNNVKPMLDVELTEYRLALNSVNWMIDDNTTLNIAPRKVDLYVLTLARDEILGLGLRFMILPAVVLLLCLVVFLRRRN